MPEKTKNAKAGRADTRSRKGRAGDPDTANVRTAAGGVKSSAAGRVGGRVTAAARDAALRTRAGAAELVGTPAPVAGAKAPTALLPYQQKWVNDPAEVKVWRKSRRIGASWCDASDSALTSGA